jgi:hypothetical protein
VIPLAWWVWCAAAPPGSARWSAGWLTFVAWAAWRTYRVLEAQRVAEARARAAVAEAVEAWDTLDAVIAAVAPWLPISGPGSGAQSAVEPNRGVGTTTRSGPALTDREDQPA